MDNIEQLGAMLQPLLNDPETMNSLRLAAEQMGLGGLLPGNDAGSSDASRNDTAAKEKTEEKEPRASGLPVSAELLTAVTKLAPLLNAPAEDNTARLLTALRPFLSPTRIKRLDEAQQLLSLARVLSIMKESKLM